MQVLFGVVGDSRPAGEVFARLLADTLDSNPGLDVAVESDRETVLGHAGRSFAMWQDAGSDRSFYLDGAIRAIDGRETGQLGASERELELLAALFGLHGPAIWERLDGSFCLIIRDGLDVHIGVDVGGTRSVYWWFDEGLLGFHSHLVDLAPAFPGALTEDPAALGMYLECEQYPPGATAYRQIRHLGAGQAMSVVGGEVLTRTHFRMAFDDPLTVRPTTRRVDDLIDRLEVSIGRSWRAATEPVVPLSGGMDSRYLAAEVVRQVGDPGAVQTITWGEDPSRPDSDAVIAARVAASLGAANTWWQKEQRHTTEAFERAIYLSSGEADCAIHYPEDHLLHARLAGQVGFVSLFRGDECFGWSKYKLLTNRGALATSLIARLSMDAGYDGIVDPELLERMAREQADLLDASIADLRSTTPTGRCDEIYYDYRFRRVLAPYNTVKHADLEVYTPFIDRHLLEWIKRVPDNARVGKKLFHEALVRRFPDLAAIPFAARSNLPDWERRWSSDPGVAGFFHSWCAEPGWLDTLGTKPEILAVLRDMETGAAANMQSVGPEPSEEGRRATMRRAAKRTYPGQLLREMTLERRYARNIPPYLRFARLAVLHGLLGRIQQRRSSNRVLDATIARSTVDP